MKNAIMKNSTLILLFFCSLISCNSVKKEAIKIDFNDEIKINDILELPKYKKLFIDEDYKEYINDKWEFKMGLISKYPDAIESQALASLNADNNEDLEGLKSIASTAYSFTKTGKNLLFGLYELNSLDKTKNKLYETFSNTKISLANNFEVNTFDFLDSNCVFPQNHKVKFENRLQNYKSLSLIIKRDEQLTDDLEDLGDDVDDLFMYSFDLKTKILLNNILKKDATIPLISKHGIEILNSDEVHETLTSSSYLNRYFKLLKKVVSKLNNMTFQIPIEDWNEDKKNDYNFIINDVKVRIKNDLSNFSSLLSPKGLTNLENNTKNIVDSNSNDVVKEVKTYFENGQLESISYKKNGKLNGEFKTYLENGQIELAGSYKNGKVNGEVKKYNKSGQLESVSEYSEGVLYIIKSFHENGKLKTSGNIVGNNKIGEWSVFYENGQLVTSGKYEEGKKVGNWKRYYENGELEEFGKYEKDEQVGHWKFYHKNGKLSANGEFLNNVKHGEWRYFYDNGEIKMEAFYENGKLNGETKEYFENEQISSSGEMSKGKKEIESKQKYPQASKRLLTLNDLEDMPSEELKIMRNEIFARYGHSFSKGGAMESYFKNQSWYTSKNLDATNLLTEIEKKNIKLIKTMEQH
ncbi:YARHG domain-containing protein [Lutibacter flavus]|uniref:Antitoxin component YwqK of the YwqJK toxin-antitoxin module n=1 Tax=Lutibacter flavus TaxID=691689 RepID=A0A238VUM0_9FLAO|nr:YARHG domain-containing protein [Lutibacter flavus]SNR37881.1 Antitoxin component YwqK of the YwqJK toxin-antitoxin module [Lutibacter flavus]